MKTHFYVGAMESDYATIHGEKEDVHFLTRLDYVLTAYSPEEASVIDEFLKGNGNEFIRSDTPVRTFVRLDILNERVT